MRILLSTDGSDQTHSSRKSNVVVWWVGLLLVKQHKEILIRKIISSSLLTKATIRNMFVTWLSVVTYVNDRQSSLFSFTDVEILQIRSIQRLVIGFRLVCMPSYFASSLYDRSIFLYWKKRIALVLAASHPRREFKSQPQVCLWTNPSRREYRRCLSIRIAWGLLIDWMEWSMCVMMQPCRARRGAHHWIYAAISFDPWARLTIHEKGEIWSSFAW